MRVALRGWLGLGTYTSLARPRRPGELHSALDTGHEASRTNPAAGHQPTSGRPVPTPGTLTSGQRSQLALQGEAGVAGPEHLGRQAIHQVLQVRVQTGGLNTGKKVGLKTWSPLGTVS